MKTRSDFYWLYDLGKLLNISKSQWKKKMVREVIITLMRIKWGQTHKIHCYNYQNKFPDLFLLFFLKTPNNFQAYWVNVFQAFWHITFSWFRAINISKGLLFYNFFCISIIYLSWVLGAAKNNEDSWSPLKFC